MGIILILDLLKQKQLPLLDTSGGFLIFLALRS